MSQEIEPGSYGFKSGQSFTYALWEQHALIYYCITNNIPLYLTSTDIEKFFPSINWLVLCWETFSLGLKEEDVRDKTQKYMERLADSEYEISTFLSRVAKLKVGTNLLGEVFESYGVREGSMGSPNQANIVINILKRCADNSGLGLELFGTNMTTTGVADDAIYAAGSLTESIALQETVFQASSQLAFVSQNAEKANFIIISNNYEEDKRRYESLNLQRKNKIQEVKSFEYLGTYILAEDMDLQNVFKRIDKARAQLDGLLYNGFVGKRILPLEVRLLQTGMFVNTSCLTTLETFYIDTRCENAVKIFGNDVVRTTFGLSKNAPPGPLLMLTGQTPLNAYLRANIVGLVLRMIATKDARVYIWVKGLESGTIHTENNLIDLFKKILEAHGVKNTSVLFKENNVNKKNVKSLCKIFRKIILQSEFNRLKLYYLSSEKFPYLNVSDMYFGTIYPSFVGGGSHAECHGARIGAWVAASAYFTYSKKNPRADCILCGGENIEGDVIKSGDRWTHYCTYCPEITERFGSFWVNMLEIMIRGKYHPIQDFDGRQDPVKKLLFIIDPAHRKLQELRLDNMDERFPEVVANNRRFLWNVHNFRSQRDAGMKIKGIIEYQKLKKRKEKRIKKSFLS